MRTPPPAPPPRGAPPAKVRPSDSTAGFSLIEVTVAAALLAVLTLSTLLTIIPLSRQTRLNREVEAATHAISNLLEQVHATPFNDLLTLYPDGGVRTVPDLPNGSITVSYADPTTDPLVLTMVLTWDHEFGAITRSFTTVRTE